MRKMFRAQFGLHLSSSSLVTLVHFRMKHTTWAWRRHGQLPSTGWMLKREACSKISTVPLIVTPSYPHPDKQGLSSQSGIALLSMHVTFSNRNGIMANRDLPFLISHASATANSKTRHPRLPLTAELNLDTRNAPTPKLRPATRQNGAFADQAATRVPVLVFWKLGLCSCLPPH